MARTSDTALPNTPEPHPTLAEDFTDRARGMGKQAERVATDALNTAREVGAKAQDMANQFRPAVDDPLKISRWQPWPVLQSWVPARRPVEALTP